MLKRIRTAGNPGSKIILSGWMIFLMIGCNPIASPNTPEGISPTQNAQPTEAQGVSTPMNASETPASSGPENLIGMVKADLAQRLSVSAEQINVVESVEVEWSDSSLDCPQPDMLYTQVITPGYRILLEVNGQTYEYHSNRDTHFVYCENLVPPIVPKP